MKFKFYPFWITLLLAGGCGGDRQQSVPPLWQMKTPYPVSFLQNIDENSIGASAIKRYLVINKETGQVSRDIPLAGASIAGMIWEDSLLYYGTSDRFFRCYDTRKQVVVWESPTTLENEALMAVDQTTVYGGSRDHFFYAYDKQSGKVKWTFKTESPIYARPVLQDSLVIIGSWDTRLYALQRETGREIWRFTAQAGIDQLPLIVNQSLWLPNYDYHIYGLDLQNGKTIFSYVADNAFEFGGADWKETLIFSGIDRRFYFIRPGEEQTRVRGESPVAISTAPLVRGDVLYTGQYDGCLYRWELPGMTRTRLHRFRDRVVGLLADGQYLWATAWDRSIACFPLDAATALPDSVNY